LRRDQLLELPHHPPLGGGVLHHHENRIVAGDRAKDVAAGLPIERQADPARLAGRGVQQNDGVA
jgi:hypothetical protein